MRYLLLFISLTLFGTTMQDFLAKGEAGDFVVFEQNKLITLLSIHSLKAHSILLEEISLPSHLKPKDWHAFTEAKARGATSHLLYEIDLSSGEVIECYSLTKKAFLPPPSFLHALLKLSLSPSRDIKKIGPPPPPGEIDRRAPWSPSLIVEGVKKRPSSFSVFTCVYPKDDTELSGKQVTLYFASETPFPIYLEVNDPHYTYKLFSINSGKHLAPTYSDLPRRYPSFIGSVIKSPTLYTLKLFSPSYYHSYTLKALNHETGEISSITPTLSRQKDLITLTFPADELEKNRTYTFLAVPDEFPNYYAESKSVKL